MALIKCKECGREVHERADPCPQCGVDAPGVSYEEQELLRRIEAAKRDEDYYAEKYTNLCGGGGGLSLLLRRKEIARYVDAANASQQKVIQLEAELRDLRDRKWGSQASEA